LNNQADIRDIQVLGDLKAAFGRFGEELQHILPALQKQFEEIQEQLDDRQKHWRQQLDEAKEALYNTRQSLNECESQGEDEEGNSPDCSFEQDEVTDAEKALAENEDNLETVKQWRHRIESQIADFQNDIHRLSNLASSRTGSAQAFLANKIEILNNYIGGFSSAVQLAGLQGKGGHDRITPEKLTEVETKALHEYTQIGGSFQLNKMLRDGNCDEDTLHRSKIISQALVKLPSYTGIVYSGKFKTLAEISIYKPGDLVLHKDFTSSSTYLAIAEIFGQAFDGAEKVLFTINSKKGKNINPFSEFQDEAEILFDKDTQFKVLSRENLNGVWQIQLEEI
jgi:hypothetical protein